MSGGKYGTHASLRGLYKFSTFVVGTRFAQLVRAVTSSLNFAIDIKGNCMPVRRATRVMQQWKGKSGTNKGNWS